MKTSCLRTGRRVALSWPTPKDWVRVWDPSLRNAVAKRCISSSSLPSSEQVQHAVTTLGLHHHSSSSSLLQGENEYFLSDQCIKSAFQKMIKLHHPDVAVHSEDAVMQNDRDAEAYNKGMIHKRSENRTTVKKNKIPAGCGASSSHSVSSSFCYPSSLGGKAAVPPPSTQDIVVAYQLLRRLSVSQREILWMKGKDGGRRPSSTVFHGQEDFTYTPEEYERAMKIYRGYPRPPSMRTASSTFSSASTMTRSRVKGQCVPHAKGTGEEGWHSAIPVENGRCEDTTARAVGADRRTAAFNARHHPHASLSSFTDAWSKSGDAVEEEKRRNVYASATAGWAGGRSRAREMSEAERWFACASGGRAFSSPRVFPTSSRPSSLPRSRAIVSRHHHHHRPTMWDIVRRLFLLWRKN